MALHTADELTERLGRRQADFRWRGQVVENATEHPDFIPTLLSWGGWLYQAAFDPETAETMVARPDLNGEDCHVFWHIATTAEDLLQNLKAAQLLAERSPLTGYASIGRDELTALLVATYDLDQARGTDYHRRVTEYVRSFQREQLMTAAAVTDVKGNRGLRPGEQDDPDMYLHVVDRSDEGIVVRGAKSHTSGSVGAEELVVIPTRAMRANEAQYAVAFAVPVDTPGITLVARALNAGSDNAWEAPISSHDELAETFTVFNDVFVPRERVFLDGEWEYAGDVANAFASVNRQGYLGTESGKLRIFIGAAQRIAELNGVAHVGHIREKIAQLIRMERSIWALGVAASLESHTRAPGYQIPDPVLTNAGKHLCMESHFTACRLLLEIAGGSVTTAPLLEDLQAPDIKPLVEKYFRGAEPDSAWERLRVFKLIRDLAASEYSGYWNTEIIHGSGSPAAEVLAMYRETDLDACKALAARALQGRDAIAPAAAAAAAPGPPTAPAAAGAPA